MDNQIKCTLWWNGDARRIRRRACRVHPLLRCHGALASRAGGSWRTLWKPACVLACARWHRLRRDRLNDASTTMHTRLAGTHGGEH